jgi:hypothetical protein
MTPSLLRLWLCVAALTGLAACSRATYHFRAPAVYLASPLALPAAPPSLHPGHSPTLALAQLPAQLRRPHKRMLRPSMAHPQPWTRPEPEAVVVRGHRLAHRAARQSSAAGYGPYFSGADFAGLLALLALFALLISALIALVAFLLTKLIVRLVGGRSRRTAPEG